MSLLETLGPVLDVIKTLDLKNPAECERALKERFPLDGPLLQKARAELRAGVVDGTLCTKENAGVKFSRLLKADAASSTAWSIDLVHMSSAVNGGDAASHTHPSGEVDLCFAVPSDLAGLPGLPGEGEPKFDGHAPGWTVYAPGTWHVPSVRGGVMDIVYFLPKGQIVFEPKPG